MRGLVGIDGGDREVLGRVDDELRSVRAHQRQRRQSEMKGTKSGAPRDADGTEARLERHAPKLLLLNLGTIRSSPA